VCVSQPDTQIDLPMSHSGKTLREGARQVFQLDVYTLITFGLSSLMLGWRIWLGEIVREVHSAVDCSISGVLSKRIGIGESLLTTRSLITPPDEWLAKFLDLQGPSTISFPQNMSTHRLPYALFPQHQQCA
jgi:hypothetical protein